MSANPTPSRKLLPYRYDAAHHRWKHCKAKSPAHFVRDGSAIVGKCASSLSKVQAEVLLKEGVTYPQALGPGQHPEKIFNVFEGVIYEAVVTEPGQSYHGYPWRFLPGRSRIPQGILRDLESRAIATGFGKEFKQWMKEYGW